MCTGTPYGSSQTLRVFLLTRSHLHRQHIIVGAGAEAVEQHVITRLEL